MTYPLPVDTAHVRPRTRQYRLMKWDLGEGVERATLKVGALAFATWLPLCWLVGVPVQPRLLMLWLLPPALFTHYAATRDESGRLRLRSWADRADGLRPARRHPIVNGGTGPATPPAPIETDIEFLVVSLDQVTDTLPADIRADLAPPPKEPTHAFPAA